MPRYEYTAGASPKFWEIELSGTSYTTTHGRVGSAGRSATRTFASEAEATKAYEKQIAGKLGKGYVEVAAGGERPVARAKTASKKTYSRAAPTDNTTRVAAPVATAGGASESAAGQPETQRFEMTTGNSNKFWEVTLEGATLTVRYGRIGARGQRKVKDLASENAALVEREKLIAQKTRKGYVRVRGNEPRAPIAVVDASDLEAVAMADPDNREARLIYADWLQGQGDPRGELIAVQLALGTASGTQRTQLQREETRILRDHNERLVPARIQQAMDDQERRRPRDSNRWSRGVWERGCTTIHWDGGFITRARIAREREEGESSVEELLGDLLDHPSGRLLRELEIGPLGVCDTFDYSGVVDVLVGRDLPLLQAFSMADFSHEDCELSWSELGSLGRLWKAIPNVERVVVRGGSFSLGFMELPRARSFAARTGGLARDNIEAICQARWPELQHLEIWFGNSYYGADGEVQDIEAIFQGRGSSQLTSLGLMNAEFTDSICRRLPRSPIARQLTDLDLSMGTMTDEGATALTRDRRAFPRLERLTVSDNYLSRASMAKLQAITGQLFWGDQGNPEEDEEDRYVSVGE